MWTKEEKEVTELVFCKQIIRILITSIIEIVISNKKPRFDVLIKSQFHCDQKYLSILYEISLFCLYLFWQKAEILSASSTSAF